jgi:hypothetical protein
VGAIFFRSKFLNGSTNNLAQNLIAMQEGCFCKQLLFTASLLYMRQKHFLRFSQNPQINLRKKPVK